MFTESPEQTHYRVQVPRGNQSTLGNVRSIISFAIALATHTAWLSEITCLMTGVFAHRSGSQRRSARTSPISAERPLTLAGPSIRITRTRTVFPDSQVVLRRRQQVEPLHPLHDRNPMNFPRGVDVPRLQGMKDKHTLRIRGTTLRTV
jgi:hypothetical protein